MSLRNKKKIKIKFAVELEKNLDTGQRRKSEELNECHELGESVPIKIDECDNFADPQTKYLTTKVWLRHLHYTHNISGDPPPVVVKNKKKIVSIDESNKE